MSSPMFSIQIPDANTSFALAELEPMGERYQDTFGTMAAESRVAEDRHQFGNTSGQRRHEKDVVCCIIDRYCSHAGVTGQE